MTEAERGAASAPQLRVLYVQHRFPVTSETFVINEVEGLRRRGHAVAVVTARVAARMWRPADDLAGHGQRVGHAWTGHLRWLVASPRAYLGFLGVLLGAPFRDIPFALLAPAAAWAARPYRPHHVRTHFSFRSATVAKCVGALLGAPTSVTTHANDIFVPPTRDTRRRLNGTLVLTISDFNQRFLEAMGIRSRVVRCGVDQLALRRHRRPLEDRGRDLLFVGRFVEKKAPQDFVRLAAHLASDRDLRVSMVGEGPLLSKCKAMAGQLNVPIEFVGSVSHAQTLTLMGDSRILCMPCVVAEDGDVDGIPVVLMEAMALGTLVVTTGVSGIPELVEHGAGWCVAPSEGVEGLAHAIREADSLLEYAEVWAKADARVGSTFSIDMQVDGVESAVLSSRGPAATHAHGRRHRAGDRGESR